MIKVYYRVDLRFKFRTLESDGLIMFNDGVAKGEISQSPQTT